ncbi:putative Bone morphogenetic protein receptor type-2 [Cocos nucifera]|uniref:Putative Bone morphogenetic protein receptor type-2 n=1 Tax=Cocos nucifera TaxID=13894 RepID=A0A8K0IPY6_COCNU|nr:putative Bone morphogenetic protein receptor type-2 [Cocos nucifera]
MTRLSLELVKANAVKRLTFKFSSISIYAFKLLKGKRTHSPLNLQNYRLLASALAILLCLRLCSILKLRVLGMRLSLVACTLLLLLPSITTQAIHVEAQPYDVFNKRTYEKGSNLIEGADEGALCGENGRCRGIIMGRRLSRTMKGVRPRLLSFREDYYGPGDHKSTHH